MLDKVKAYIEEYHMIQQGDRIIAGVSGGADSVAMLDMLQHCRGETGFELMVLHVNHNLRGEEALRDEHYVKMLCESYGIAYACESVDVERLAHENHLSLEEAGREARLAAFRRQKQRWQGNKIALAHNCNDVAETVLHHLCRGTSLKGLCGILPVQGDKIRPLLCLERREIEQYLQERGLNNCEDGTNALDHYTRNRIRHHILPVMQQEINDEAVRHISAAAGDLRQIQNLLGKLGEDIIDKYVTYDKEGALLAAGLFEEHPVLIREAVMQVIEKVCGGRKDVGRYHLHETIKLMEKQVGSRIMLPKGWCVRRVYQGLQLARDSDREDRKMEESMDISSADELYISPGIVRTRVFSYEGDKIPEKRYTKWLNYDKINKAMQIRHRRAGDYLVMNESGQHKKIKDYFIECKIPAEERDQIWLLAMGSEILWVIGYRINESYRIRQNTREVMEIIYEGGSEDGREN